MGEANPRPTIWPRWDLQKKQPADPNPNFQPQKCEPKNDHATLVNPNEDQILPTAFNLLHAEVMLTAQLHEKSTCEMRSQKLCARLPYPFPPPTSQVSPLSMPLITRVNFEGSCCHIRSALTLRTVVFTSIQSVFPVTSIGSGCSTRKVEQVYYWAWKSFTVLTIITEASLSLLWPKVLLFLQQPCMGHDFKFLDHPICCPPHGP